MARQTPYIVVFLCVLLGAAPAIAQDDPLQPEGIHAGRVRLHPGVFVGGAWDSNLFYDDDDPTTSDGEPDDVIAVTAGVSFRATTDSPKNVDWWADARVSWEQYFLGDRRASDVSGIQSTISTGFHFWPKGPFKLSPMVSYTRTNGPADDFSYRNLNQHSFHGAVDGVIQPSEGKVFSQTIGYDGQVQLYDEADDINKHAHEVHSITRWNFLAQTAASLLLSQSFVRYFQGDRPPPGGIDPGFTLTNVNSNPFRAQLGLKGLLFNRVDVMLLGGYGYTGYDSGDNSHVFLAAVEVGYKWTEKDRLSAGYARNFNDSSFGNFFTFHRGYVRFQTRFFERLSAALTGRITYQTFSPVTGVAGERSDLIYDADLTLSYIILPGFLVKFAYLLRGDQTDFQVVINGRPTSSSYLKHIVELTLSYEY